MNKGIFTTAYLPPVEYFSLLKSYPEILIEQYENYQKQSYRNRCRIAGPNNINELSIPIDKQGQLKVCIKDLRISYDESWQQLHWRSILTAYNNSPFFLYYRDELQVFYSKKYKFLLDLNTALLELVIKWLKIQTQLSLTDSFIPLNSWEDDHRYRIHPKKESGLEPIEYHQVFREKFGFIPRLSIIDLVFNEGPDAGRFY